jgi:rod shape-determining protein MreC
VLRKSRSYKKFYKLIFFICLSCLSFTIYKKTFLKNYIDSSLGNISYGSVSLLDSIGDWIKRKFDSIRPNDSLYKENVELKNEIEILKQSIATLESELQKFKILRNEFKYYADQKTDYITVRLVSITPGPYIKQARINGGSNLGIERGDIVLYRQMLLGRIIEVHNDFSVVLLIFDPRSKISVITQNSRKKIVLEGNNGMRLDIKYLLDADDIVESEFVETSNYCTLFPSGIKIGVINAKNIKKPYVHVSYELKDINYVQIIKNDQAIPIINEDL